LDVSETRHFSEGLAQTGVEVRGDKESLTPSPVCFGTAEVNWDIMGCMLVFKTRFFFLAFGNRKCKYFGRKMAFEEHCNELQKILLTWEMHIREELGYLPAGFQDAIQEHLEAYVGSLEQRKRGEMQRLLDFKTFLWSRRQEQATALSRETEKKGENAGSSGSCTEQSYADPENQWG